jgi:hypothetical protein
LFPWNASIDPYQKDPAILKEPHDPLKLARHCLALLD